MPRRCLPLASALGLVIASGCHELPVLGGKPPAPGATPVVVVPEPPIAVPVPLAPGEMLLDTSPQPYYLAPGVAPPAGIPPFPETFAPPPPPKPPHPKPPHPGLLDALADPGGALGTRIGLPAGPTVENRLPNPLPVTVANRELAWDEIADVVSDFFPIAQEQPVQFNDGVLTEGFIVTAPQVGATLLEPHRPDSVGLFNRLQATFQTIRRRAVLKVAPTAEGYAIGVEAFRELEDLPRPIGASAGAATLRNDNALPSARLDDENRTRESDRWIVLGRDEPLEQELLSRIQERLTGGGR